MIIAVDTGGTKTLVAAFSKEGELLKQSKFPTPRELADYTALLLQTINDITRGKEITAICVALAGIVRKDGVLEYGPNLGWREVDIKQLLHKHISCPVFVENDANLGGLGAVNLIEDTPRSCLYVTVSTGIGAGLIINKKLAQEVSVSESGHILLEHDGVLREWESFASGRAIRETYKKFASEITSKRVWNVVSKNIAQGLLALWPVLRPEMIIIGGSIGTYFERYGDHLNGTLREYLSYRAPLVVASPYPEEVVIYGCYYYALDRLAD